jgi:hypothetical protein
VSPEVLKHETSDYVVPLHEGIKLGTLAGILKKTGVRTGDFMNLLYSALSGLRIGAFSAPIR